MTGRVHAALVTAILLFGAASPASAGPRAPRFLDLGGAADAPSGYLEMCLRQAGLCALSPSSAPVDSIIVSPSSPASGIVETGAAMPSGCGEMRATSFIRHGVATAATAACFGGWSPVVRAETEHLAPTAAILGSSAPEPRRADRPRRKDSAEVEMLRRVNAQVNRSVRQRSDQEIYGASEYWDRPDRVGAGDCEDFAIEKRIRLIADGFDPALLSYAVVFRQEVGLHVVLVARVAGGDLVLDSLTSRVRRWSDARFRWLRVQSPGDPATWRTLAG